MYDYRSKRLRLNYPVSNSWPLLFERASRWLHRQDFQVFQQTFTEISTLPHCAQTYKRTFYLLSLFSAGALCIHYFFFHPLCSGLCNPSYFYGLSLSPPLYSIHLFPSIIFPSLSNLHLYRLSLLHVFTVHKGLKRACCQACYNCRNTLYRTSLPGPECRVSRRDLCFFLFAVVSKAPTQTPLGKSVQ